MSDAAATIRAAMSLLGKLRWERMSPEQRVQHVKRMVAGQRRKRLHRRARQAKGASQ